MWILSSPEIFTKKQGYSKMISYKEFVEVMIMDEHAALEEAMIVLANQKEAQFGNVVILAGGAGAGKGFVIDNLLQIRGKTLDVDKLKTMSLLNPKKLSIE